MQEDVASKSSEPAPSESPPAPGQPGPEPVAGAPSLETATKPPTASGRWQTLFGRNPRLTLLRLVCWYGIIWFVFRILLLPIAVVGTSMSPTFLDGQTHLVNRWPYSRNPPKRTDVVAVRIDPTTIYLKRVVGLPGETVSVRRGRIFINGKSLEEPYAFSRIKLRQLEVSLGPEEYFIIGDNRPVTVFGVIKRSQIVGRLVW